MSEKTDKTNKLQFKESVGTGAFLAFVLWIIYTMATNSLIHWFKWSDGGFKLVVGIIVFAGCMIFGLDRAGVMATVMAILKVTFDPKMSLEAKLAFIKESIEKLIGIGMVVQSQIVEQKTP